MKDTVRLLCATLALISASYASVTVSSPATGSTAGSPVHVIASANASLPITGMRIYVDSVSVYHVSSSSINTSIPVAAGKHNIVVMAWDSSGASQKSGTIAVTVSSTATPTPTPTPSPSPSPTATPTPTPAPTPGATPTPSPTPSPSPAPSPSPSPTPVTSMPTPPANAIVKNDIDQMTGWESCTVCAGANAAGPVAVYAMTQNILSPALDSNAAQFDIGGTNVYASALWWKQLGANNAIRNFKYDLNFYLKTPQAAQALEFDVNQSDGMHKFIFGTQCNIKDGGVWDVYANSAGHWTHTNIPCAMPSAFTWHHLTWEFQRTDTNVIFIGFTLDGVTHYVNQSYPAKTSTAKEINVAFQLDLDGHADAYSAWLDKVSLTYW